MNKIISRLVLWLIFILSNVGLSFAEGKPATELNKTVRTDGLSGLNLFLAETYNENRFLYAIISTVSVILLGLIVTWIVSKIIKPKYSLHKEE